MFCDKCGGSIEAGAKFCRHCGSLVTNAKQGQQNQNYDSNQNSGFPGGTDNSGFGGDSYNSGNTTVLNNNNFSGGYNANAGYNPNAGNNANAGQNPNAGYNGNSGYNVNAGYGTNSTEYNGNQGNAGVNGSMNAGYGNNLNQGNNNGYNTAYGNGYGNFQQPSPMPKSKKPIFVGILAVILVVGLLAGSYFTFGKNMLIKRDPVKRTLTSMTNVAKANAVDSETVIKLKLDGAAGDNVLLKTLAEDLALKINSKTNKEKTQGDFKVSFVMKKQSIIDLNIYADQDIVVISSQGVLDKPLYFNTKDINKLTGQEGAGTSTSDMKAYEALLKDLDKNSNYKAMSKNYSQFFMDVLKDFTKKSGSVDVKVVEGGKERSIKCDETTVTIDENFVKKVVKGLLEKIASDSNLKALIKEKADEFYKLAEKNGDLEKFGLKADTFKEDMKNFDSEWDKSMKELKDSLNEMDKEMASLKLNSTAKFKVDSSNRLRQLTYEIDGGATIGEALGMEGLSGSVIIETTFNAFDGDVKITKPSTNGGQNLAEMDQFELMDLMGKVQEKLQVIIGKNFGGMQ